MAIFDSELSATDVTNIYGTNGTPGSLSTFSTFSPVGWWRMGEGATWDGSNWTIPDLGKTGGVLNNNHGTSNNIDLADRVTDTP